MGWKGTLRAIEAAERRSERESQRRYKQLLRESKERAKMEARQQCAFEVDFYENQIERILSIHKECPEPWDWNLIFNTPPPLSPERPQLRGALAQSTLDEFKPSLMDKLLGRVDKKRGKLESALQLAQSQDEAEYQTIYAEYHQRYTDWNDRRELAWKVLHGDIKAYVEALEDFNPFSDVKELGANVECTAHTAQLFEVRLIANQGLIPDEIKSLTAAGKVSTKPMPRSRQLELYRDFVCAAALRVGRELFAFIPVQAVLVTIRAKMLNTATGHTSTAPILSVAFFRPTFSSLDFERLNPADAMENFPHRIEFSKSAGFEAVEPITAAQAISGDFTRKAEPTSERINTAPPQPSEPELMERLLMDYPIQHGCHWLPVSKAANLVGILQETKLTIAQRRKIAEKIQSAGYCVEPDGRYDPTPQDWNGALGVFKPDGSDDRTPSLPYVGAARLLKLCVLVAGADGHIDERELDVVRDVIAGQLHLSTTDLLRLKVLEHFLINNQGAAQSALLSIAKFVPSEKRTIIAEVLVRVAAADNVITRDEHKALDRIFKALQLPPESLVSLIEKFGPRRDEVTIQTASPAPPSERIPEPPSAPAPEPHGFKLDMSKIQAISEETKVVIGILSEVMDEVDPAPARPVSLEKAKDVAKVPPLPDAVSASTYDLTGLDASLHAVVGQLLQQESWTKAAFDALAKSFHLMPLGLYDSINEWADEALGDFLLEGEDPILVRKELIKQQK